ncbi:MAG: CaiB/BaiF CoA-transferase family protein [Candidatus Promineifilaceae bacterium]|nr:CaiB/BaiF CoA-transferase family protein [Candidatus Promineifilaceae bacterium]
MSSPLSSLKILDFTTLLPGPWATMILADLGAEVLRIEAPNRPDMVRLMPPFDGDSSAWHSVLNRSKRSLGLDMKQPGAVEIVKRLVSHGGYDIVIEQFRPGVMDRLGIGYEALRTTNPRLIYCTITGYGQNGPLRERAGHDINYVSLAGIMSHSGRQEEGPAPLGVQLADIGGGSLGAIVGLLSAIIHRQVSGVGQLVDISMLDMMLAWQAHIIGHYLVGQEVPQRESLPLNGGGAYDFYETADGRYLSVGSLEPKFWIGFCQAIERPDLIDKGYIQDRETQQSLKREIGHCIAARPLAEWTAIFAPLDLCVEPVLEIDEVLEHPQVQARRMVVEVEKGEGATQRQIGSPFKFSASEVQYRHSGAKLGAHAAEVLTEIGYSESEIETFRSGGLLG